MRLSDLFRDMDISALGLISLLLFSGIFAIAFLLTLLRRPEVDEFIARIPLEDDDPKTSTPALRLAEAPACPENEETSR